MIQEIGHRGSGSGAVVGVQRFMENITMLLAMGGYALAKLRFPGREFLTSFVLAALVIPGALLLECIETGATVALKIVHPHLFRTQGFFKGGIRQLVMAEFFTREHIQRFLQSGAPSASDLESKVDFDRVFEGLVEAIEGSSMGSMLAMVGGRAALEPLREPVQDKMREDHGIYMVGDSRMNIAGLNKTTVPILAEAIVAAGI